jgi:hypothetical protein
MRRTLLLPLGSLALAALVRPALADAGSDWLSGTRFEVTEEAHTIAVRIDRGHAVLVVQRTVANPGDRSDQAVFHLWLPDGAVATGLRSLGMRGGEHVWFDAELMEAEEAAAKYEELTGRGGYYPKDPALLSWRSQSHLALQVFPVAAHGLKTVEYTLELPTLYDNGRHVVSVPPMGTEARAAQAVVTAAHASDALFADGKPLAPGSRIPLDHQVILSIVPHDPPPVGGALGVVRFGRERVLMRTRFELAPRISEAPAGAYVVVLLDVSRSMAEGDVATEAAAARAYLGWMPRANVQVVAFDRVAHPLYDGFVSVERAIEDLDSYEPERHNGSHIDRALAVAGALLAKAPRGAARRIVAITDLRTRSALVPTQVKAAVARSGAVVHVATIDSGNPSLARDDADPWAVVPRATGGVLWHASGNAREAAEGEMEQVYEEWARPVRIDRVAVEAPELAAKTLEPPGSLAEGMAFEDTRIAPAQASSVALTGEMWSRPVRTTLVPDANESRLWCALVFGSPLLGELDEREMMSLARCGHAVSPVTSLLAIEPGVRPSTEGLEVGEGMGSGLSHCKGGHVYGVEVPGPAFDHAAFLRSELARGWRACGGDGRPATVTLETTGMEVVDVPSAAVEPDDPRLARCLGEVAWGLDLPGEFTQSFQSWTVKL